MRWILVMTLVSMSLAGCASPEEGSASIYLKDAPTDTFTEIHVVVTQAAVHGSGNASDNGTWTILFEDDAGLDIDLLATQGPFAAFLGEANLTAGRYQQIRVEVAEAYGITHDGERLDITVSSGTLRSVRSFTVEGGQETRITVEMDLERSLRENPNGWRMTPVIGKTTATVVEDDKSGSEVSEPGDVEELGELDEA